MKTLDSLSIFGHLNFRRLYYSTAASQIGMQVSVVGVSLTAVLVVDASEFEIGVLNSMSLFALLIFGLPAGVWIDRIRRRRILIAGDVARFLLLFSIPIAWGFDVLSIWQMYAVAFLVGVATVFFDVSYTSYVPSLVGRDNLTRANSSIQAVHSVAFMVGPALAGPVIAVFSGPIAVLLASLLIGGSVWWTLRITHREVRNETHTERNLRREIADGIRFVMKNAIIRSVAMTAGWCNISVGLFQSMGVVYLVRELELSSIWVGIILAGSGIGGVLGAFAAPRLSRRFGIGPVAWISLAASGPTMALVPLAQSDWRVVLALLGEIAFVAAIILFNINTLSYRQAVTPDSLLGRVSATQRVIAWGAMPIGAILGGLLGEAYDARTALWVASAMLCVGFVPLLATPLRTLRELPDSVDSGAEGASTPG